MIKSMIRSEITDNRWYDSMNAGNDPTGDFELIQSVVLTGSTASVTFSSIPQTYENLQVRMVTRNDAAAVFTTVFLRINSSNTTADYRYHGITGNSQNIPSAFNNTDLIIGDAVGATGPANAYTAQVVDILDYASSSKNKVTRTLTGHATTSTNSRIGIYSGLYKSVAPLTTINFSLATGNFVTGSRFSLYGIKG
jgi:hypothetical protein